MNVHLEQLMCQLDAAELNDYYFDAEGNQFVWDDYDLIVRVALGDIDEPARHHSGMVVYITTPCLVKNGQAVELIEKLVNQLRDD